MKSLFRKFVSFALVFSLAGLPFTAQAGLIGTGEAIAQSALPSDRTRVEDFLSRADVQGQLEQHGLTRQVAKDRVDALTNVEIAQIAGKIDALPAGGTTGVAGVIGVALLLVLIIYTLVRVAYPQK